MKFKKIILTIIFIPLFFLGIYKSVFAWDLQPVADNQTNYGFSVSPSGVNSDYFLDIEYYSATNIPRLIMRFDNAYYKDLPLYYDFSFNLGIDSEYNYSYYDADLDFTFEYEFERSPYHINDITREISLIGTNTNQNINACDNYFTRFYGYLGSTMQLKRLNLYIARKHIHLYLYIGQENILNIKKYYNSVGIIDFNIDDYFETFRNNISVACPNACTQMLVCENYIFDYEYAYSSYIANSVVYYGDYLYNSEISQTNLSKYGYGFFQTTYSIKDLNISGAIYDMDVSTGALYPTFSTNMLYYVLPGQFPSDKKYSDRIKYSTLECLYSFDWTTYEQEQFESLDNIGGLYKTYNALNYSEYLQSNFYSFGFSRCLNYSNTSGNHYYNFYDLGVKPFKKINAYAYYNNNINSNDIIDNNSYNDDLATALGLKKVNCKWWDLKGQLQNLFYYIITGLPFLNNVYLVCTSILNIGRVGFNFFAFSTLLMGLFGFILLVNVVFNKLLK